ncbi:cytochrome c-type biogenesis protein [Paraferrimonas haliotis]|uniref:Cytochrome c-type biogenesis protein n=1 Tax=Paraferrimonas haliotis TaxID=2013866 RepID=A0AA37TPX1_9GAMM|nr:cytochrome c-type biogenesis protein [Paraferrimonas haliotis]GLS82227.1 cytochrome c biogenesis protein [Paraferrimonas haliotis]
MLTRPVIGLLITLVVAAYFSSATAFANQTVRDLGFEIAKELRCPMSQNKTLFESDARIASELKAHIFTMLNEGKSKQDVINFMIARYGEQIHYKPPFNRDTAFLWLAPLLLIIGGSCRLYIYLKDQ